MRDESGAVTVPCPRCGAPFVLAVWRADTGYEYDVDPWACACEPTEDEWEDLCDAAIASFEARAATRDDVGQLASPALPGDAATNDEPPDTPVPPRPLPGLWERLGRWLRGGA
jgi:hypothetical protein